MPTDKPCLACHSSECEKQAYIEEKLKNPPRGMGAGLWTFSGEFDVVATKCRIRMKTLSSNGGDYETT